MSAPSLKLTANEAATILKANLGNIDHASKRILQKVVDKRTLSDDEIGTLEGIVANQGASDAEKNYALVPAGTKKLTEFETSEIKLADIDRQKLVAELRRQHPPVPMREIATRLGVGLDRVFRDVKAIEKRNSAILNAEHSIQILGETVAQYDVLHGKCMALADKFTSPMAKSALLRTAISALDSKTRLMGETGIIHRVPERQEMLVVHADAGTVRSRVAALMRAQAERKSDTFELPPEPAQLVDADLTEAEGAQPDAD
jgi:DNA-binding Lrp family transcriptional regulator